MIEELMDLLPDFPGALNRTRCFAHIINLVAKSLLRQFDVPKKKADEALEQAEQDLLNLAEDIELEDAETRATELEVTDGDDVEGWVDEVALLTEEEAAQLSESILPVRLVLVKVRYFQYTYLDIC